MNTESKLWAACAVAAGGLFLPWVTFTAIFLGTITLNGIEADRGIAVLALMAATAVAAPFAIRPFMSVAATMFAGMSVGLVGWFLADVLIEKVELVGEPIDGVSFSVGFGLYLSMIGSIAVTVLTVQIAKEKREWTTATLSEQGYLGDVPEES